MPSRDRDDFESLSNDMGDLIAEPRTPDSDLVREERSRTWIWLGVIAGLVVAGSVGWFVWQKSQTAGGEMGVPLIAAGNDPVKVRPADPGGMQVPNQDKLVYGRLDPTEGEGRVERLLPPPEAPRAPDIAPAAPAASLPDLPVLEETPREVAEVSEPVPPPDAPTVAAPEPEPEPEPAPAAEPTPEPRAAEPPPPSPPAQQAQAPASGPMIQMAALRERAAAEREWQRLRGLHEDLLGGLNPAIERADLGERGVFYRLRAGRLADEEAARALCEALKERNVGCIVVR